METGIVEALRILDDDSDENFDSINELVSLFRISRETPYLYHLKERQTLSSVQQFEGTVEYQVEI